MKKMRYKIRSVFYDLCSRVNHITHAITQLDYHYLWLVKKYKTGTETRKIIQSDLNILRNKMKVLAILLTVVTVALAQDTHFCPDNWELHVRILLIKHLKLCYQCYLRLSCLPYYWKLIECNTVSETRRKGHLQLLLLCWKRCKSKSCWRTKSMPNSWRVSHFFNWNRSDK